jgi:hypothetical protein
LSGKVRVVLNDIKEEGLENVHRRPGNTAGRFLRDHLIFANVDF